MADFLPGVNDPSPVRRVVILDFYDGALGGALEIVGGTAFRFDYTDQAPNPDGCDERRYALRPLPAGAFERLVTVLSEHLHPHWPAWLPAWNFPSVAVQADVERQVDAVLDQAGEPRWHITTSDTVEFRTLVAEPIRTTARAVDDGTGGVSGPARIA